MATWVPMLGVRSDRMVGLPGVTVAEGDGYDVVRTPERPDYRMGNLLVLHGMPAPADVPALLAAWRQELGGAAGITRVALSAESEAAELPNGLTEAAAAHGLDAEVDDVLVLGDHRPREPSCAVAVRPVVPSEWGAVLDLAHAVHDDGEREFRAWQVGAHRQLVDAGRGRWWGAWRGGQLVGSAGLFADDTLARYQEVQVHPGHRRRGIASTLVSTMTADHLTGPHGAVPLVIVAERDSSPARIYRSVGFAPATTLCTLTGPVPSTSAP
jgi:GNAT superfamily N-acetyltransferase